SRPSPAPRSHDPSPTRRSSDLDKLNEKAAEYNKKYGTSFATDGSLTDADRLAALKAGFTRVRYVPNGGILTFEGLSGHWDRVKRSEEHTSELQSRENLVCRLLL